ncbi:MAG: Ig-like domain-containing protein [Flavobacteriaceae bacterium]|nr:Ig-like domain-containing protein [Flavobacteriaceae bacterium]
MNKIKIILLFVIAILTTNCARRGSINGGSKDTIPPVLVKARPVINSTNFDKKKIKIYFDEYIKIKDLRKNLIISPPMKHEPVITPMGTASEYISIKILDTLKPNTTYSFNFGNSIIDNNEGNKLGNFKYVFSTGNYIDSLSVSGVVADYQSKEKLKNIDVALYKYDSNYTDSIIYKKRPDYISNTLDSTLFEITNVKEGKYLLIALNDKNSNKKYEPKSDKIAFIKDTIVLPTDKTYVLSLFKEVPKFRAFPPREVGKGHFALGYEGDSKGMSVELVTKLPDSVSTRFVYEKGKDTLNFWHTDLKVDSLVFKVSKGGYIKEFTARLRTSKRDSLMLNASASGNLHLLDTFSLQSNIPIQKLDSTMIKITTKDSLKTQVPFHSFLAKDSMRLYVDFKKKHKTSYQIEMLPKALTDIFEQVNDTLSYNLKTLTPDDYVKIIRLNPKGKKKIPLIVELLQNKKVIRTAKTKTDEMVTFELIPAGTYKVRVILDENGNGKWDTGNFLEKRQSEIIKNYPTELKLKAGWEYLDNILSID